MPTLQVLVVLPLEEPVTLEARSSVTLHARAVLDALVAGTKREPGLEITAVAARGSTVSCPVVTVDPCQIGRSDARAHEVILTALALSGRMADYDVVHWLAPAPNAVLVNAARNGVSVFTPAEADLGPLLPAIAALGRIEAASAATVEAITLALHPVSFSIPLAEGPRSNVCLADSDQAGLLPRHLRYSIATQPDALAAAAPLAVFGPPRAGLFDHLVWATRSLAAGAVYIHDGGLPEDPLFPTDAVVPLARAATAIERAVRTHDTPERFRKWALAHCSPAATAARFRRRYRSLVARTA